MTLKFAIRDRSHTTINGFQYFSRVFINHYFFFIYLSLILKINVLDRKENVIQGANVISIFQFGKNTN
jgi:hypothetical protein